MSVSKIRDDKRTSLLLLLFDTDSFEAARHLNIQDNTHFETAKEEIKAYFAIKETPEKLKEKLHLRRQEAGETIELFARDIKLIGHRAYTGTDPELLKDIMIHVFICGLRNKQSRKRVLLKVLKTLTETAQYARFAEAETRVAKHNFASSTTTTNAINPRGVSYGDAKYIGSRNQQQQQRQNNGGKGRQWQPGQGP